MAEWGKEEGKYKRKITRRRGPPMIILINLKLFLGTSKGNKS